MNEILRAGIEILIFTGFFYVILRFLLETRGSGVIRGLTIVIVGLLIISLVLIRWLQLTRLEVVFQKIVEIAILGLIVIFQPEIRRAITHVGNHEFIGRMFGRFFARETLVMNQVVMATKNMARNRVGAIIAIEQVASLVPYTHRGTRLDTDANHMILETIFFPGNPLHDGAVVIQQDRIIGAGCVLPLTENEEISKRLGTRHRAALGLADETDAIVIVVSEETGAISVAAQGRLHYDLKESELKAFLGIDEEPETAAIEEASLHG